MFSLLRPAFFVVMFATLFSPFARAQDAVPGAGEIRFDGTLVSFDEAKKTLVLNVVSFTLPNGKSSKLAAPKPKTVLLSPATTLQASQPGAAVAPLLQAGATIVVIGKDAGSGKDFPARMVLVNAPTGSTPAGSTPDGGEGEGGELPLKAGEVRYDGKVTGVLSEALFTITVMTTTDANGQTQEIYEPLTKNVRLDGTSILRSRGDATRTLKPTDLKIGQRVTLVGTGTGAIKAREIAIWEEDDSKSRTLGVVTVHPMVATLADKGDQARDARVYTEAAKYFNQALTFAEGAGDAPGQALMLSRLGGIYRELEQPKRALESYQKSLAIWKRIGNTSSEATTHMGISGFYADQDDLKQARTHIDEAIRLLQGAENAKGLGIAYQRLGSIQGQADDEAGALSSWQRALEIARNLRDRSEELGSLGQVAALQARLKQNAKANESIAALLALLEQGADNEDRGWSLFMVGLSYRYMGQKPKAIEHFKLAEGVFSAANMRAGAAEALEQIAKIEKPEEAAKEEGAAAN